MSLPGADTPPTSRFLLQAGPGECVPGTQPLSLSIVRASAGLESDRIASRDADSGELTYLADVRWAERLPRLLEQQLAKDLECRGHAVVTGHHRSLGQPRLACEVRAFNLVKGGDNHAEAWLSCIYRAHGGDEQVIVSRHTGKLQRWSAESAVAALSSAYRAVLDDMVAELPNSDAGTH
jgi:ABC-type uncharacterized transport system auxiliary subunit